MRQTLNSIIDSHNGTSENQDSLFTKQEAKLGLSNDNVNLFENLYAISVKKKPNRNRNDQKVICQALKTIKFFADMQKDDMDFDSFLLRSFDLMKYEAYEKDDAVFHLGDAGDKFYIILKGSIDVFIPKTQDEITNDSYLESEHKRYHLNLRHIKQTNIEAMNSDSSSDRTPPVQQRNPSGKKLIPSHEEIADEHMKKGGKGAGIINTLAKLKVKNTHYTNHLNHMQLFYKFPEKKNLYIENGQVKFRKIRTMEAGDCFGEIALSSDIDMCRGASVIASSELHVLTLSKSAYKQIFKNVETSLKAKWNFFSELLKGTTKETITKFCYTFKERVFRYNQKIIEEGDIPRHVFVIHEGEVQVVKQEKKEEKCNNDDLKFFKKPKKLAEKKIVNLGPFSFFGEGEVLNHKKPYEYSAISMTNNTVIYSTSIKEFNALRMDHGDVFLKIFNKHQTKMEHWNVRSSCSLYNSVNMEDSSSNINYILDGHGNAKSNSPGVLRSHHFKNTHSSKFIGERLKIMLNRESFRDSLSESENRSMSHEDHSAERKKLPYENKPGTVTSASIFNQTKLVKLFDDKKMNNPKERPSLKGSLRDLKREKKSTFAKEEHGEAYILDDEENAQKLSIERFIKRKAINPRQEQSATSLLVSPKHYLPHESDLEKIRMKTNASPVRRMNFRKLASLTQSSNYEDETPKTLIGLIGASNKFDVTGQKLILDELKEQEKANFDFRKFLNNVVSTETANQFWSPKSELIHPQTEKAKKSKSKDAAPERASKKFNTTLSNGFVKRNHSTLQVSKFPVFDSIPNLAKLDSFGVGPTTGSYEDLESAANITTGEFYPKPKDKSSTMISSKHNLFRMKPKKAFLEYSHYLSPTSSSSPQKNHRNLRYKK